MANDASAAERSQQRYLALSRWESEGGSAPDRADSSDVDSSDVPPLTNTELLQMRIRVIALENLVIALLVGTSGTQRELVAEMADFISPRPGRTLHPMTLHAATQMRSLVERAGRFGFV